MIKRSGSKSILFLMEQLIALLIFAICVTACVKIFAVSHITAVDTYNLNNAMVAAKNGAECFKATGGDMEKTVEILEGAYNLTEAAVYFDSAWKPCQANDAVYTMYLRPQNNEAGSYPVLCELSVEKPDGKEIIALTVAAGRVSDE